MSAIFFGPPGTSKTELAKKIAEFLGWPHLNIDPSHLVRFGMDRVQEQANTVFSMLAASEEIVVLLDEFDEMVRERASSGTEALSRFLTTAMLPKLTLINKRRSIVFILATNHIEQFDFAISRLGRFDRIIQIMPPSAAEKRRKWNSLNKLSASENARLDLLTFSECEKLVEHLEAPGTDPKKALVEAVKTCTLKKNARPLRPKGGKPATWEKECKAQRKQNRL
jgi:SpoVK/Ycf46/Vps4 family AAA+-type ATPase